MSGAQYRDMNAVVSKIGVYFDGLWNRFILKFFDEMYQILRDSCEPQFVGVRDEMKFAAISKVRALLSRNVCVSIAITATRIRHQVNS